MKIAHVLQGMHVGGLETLVLNLSKSFSDAGHDVTIIATDCEGPWWDRIPSAGANGIHIPLSSAMSRYAHARKVAKQLAQYDVVLLHHAPIAQAVLGLVPERTAAIPVIHNDAPLIQGVACANSRNWNIAVAVGPRVAETAARALGNSRVLCISNGVLAPSRAAWLNRATLSGPPKLIFVGRIENNQKGVLLLPEILASVHRAGTPASMVVVGSGPDLTALREKFEASGLTAFVQFLGMQEPAAVYEQLLASHILLLPSMFEGLPLTAIEAQACGCVVVASKLAGITDVVIQNGTTGLLAPVRASEAFAAHVLHLANNPAQWQRMSAAAREFASREFSFDQTAARYLRVIEEAGAGDFPLPEHRRIRRVDWSLLGRKSVVPRRIAHLKRSLSTLVRNS